MLNRETLFVVINPTLQKHVAFERAISIANSRSIKPHIVTFIGVDSTRIDDNPANAALFRTDQWVEEHIHAPLRQHNLTSTVIYSWCSHWANSIVHSASECDASLILLRTEPNVGPKFTFNNAKWRVFKESKCPVLLVRSEERPHSGVVLAAVKWQTHNEEQKILNAKILRQAQAVAAQTGSQLHVVNAYKDSMSHPNRGALLAQADVPNANAHLLQGDSTQVVASVAKSLKADIVVAGTKGHSYSSHQVKVAKLEQLISLVTVDLLIVNQDH